MQFDFWQLIIAAGVFNEMILAMLLMVQRKNRQASLFLALFLFISAFNRFNYLFIPPIFQQISWFTFNRLPTQFAFGFLIWVYVLYVTDVDYKIKKRHLILGFPILLDFIYCLGRGLYIYFFRFEYKLDFLYQPFEFLIHEGLAILYNLLMLYMAHHYLGSQKIRAESEFSSYDQVHITWLRWFMRALLLVGLVWLGYYVVEINIYPRYLVFEQYYFFWLLNIAINLTFGYRNLMLSEISYATAIPKQIPGKSYSTSALSDQEIHVLSIKIKNIIIEEHMHRDPQLRLADLAKASGISPNQISQIISQGMRTNFHSLINGLRIEEVKKRLSDPKYRNQSILSIAFESGFNSKSTFNKIFKSVEGKSPSAFRREIFG